MELVEYLRQEWCNPKNIELKGSGYITLGTLKGLLVLCAVEKVQIFNNDRIPILESRTRHRPLKYTDLELANI